MPTALPRPSGKVEKVTESDFADVGGEFKAVIVFATLGLPDYPDADYFAGMEDDMYVWKIENKLTTGFTINSNRPVNIEAGTHYWHTKRRGVN